MTPSTILHAMKHYVSNVRTMRKEIRTERFLNSLPSDLRADIGWPDRHAELRTRRN